MKNRTLAVLLVMGVSLVGCASFTRPVATNQADLGDLERKAQGKTPKELKAIMGEPFSAGWKTDNMGTKVYYVVYPNATVKTIKAIDIMTDHTIRCSFLYYYQKNDYKFLASTQDDVGQEAYCDFLKNQNTQKWEFDDSKISDT